MVSLSDLDQELLMAPGVGLLSANERKVQTHTHIIINVISDHGWIQLLKSDASSFHSISFVQVSHSSQRNTSLSKLTLSRYV